MVAWNGYRPFRYWGQTNNAVLGVRNVRGVIGNCFHPFPISMSFIWKMPAFSESGGDGGWWLINGLPRGVVATFRSLVSHSTLIESGNLQHLPPTFNSSFFSGNPTSAWTASSHSPMEHHCTFRRIWGRFQNLGVLHAQNHPRNWSTLKRRSSDSWPFGVMGPTSTKLPSSVKYHLRQRTNGRRIAHNLARLTRYQKIRLWAGQIACRLRMKKLSEITCWAMGGWIKKIWSHGWRRPEMSKSRSLRFRECWEGMRGRLQLLVIVMDGT